MVTHQHEDQPCGELIVPGAAPRRSQKVTLQEDEILDLVLPGRPQRHRQQLTRL